MKKHKIITIGGVSQDIIIDYLDTYSSYSSFDTFFTDKEGSKIDIKNLTYAPGGCAANTAVSFKRLGFDTTIICKIGLDEAGSFLIKTLQDQGITTIYKTVTPLHSGTSFILPTPHKDRIIFGYSGANITLKEEDIPEDIFDEDTYTYVAPLHDKAADILPHITKKIRFLSGKKGLRIAVNPSEYQLTKGIKSFEAALSNIDLLITNKEEMGLLMGSLKPRFFKSKDFQYPLSGPSLFTGPIVSHQSNEAISFSLREYYELIFSYGVNRLVITNGKEGAYIITPDTIYFHPALPVTSVSTTVGAGDAFGSTFFALSVAGHSLDYALLGAILNAQSVIQFSDAQTGLLAEANLKKRSLDIQKELIQRIAI